MSTLPVPVLLHANESALGYFSRVAAAHGVSSLAEFCRHIAIENFGLVVGNPQSIRRIAEMAGQEPEDLLTRYIHAGESWRMLRGQAVAQAGDRRRFHLRGCPACVSEDIDMQPGRTQARAWHRLHWLAPQVRACHVHGTMLVPMASTDRRADFAAFVRDNGRQILARPGPDSLSPSPFEAYLYERIVNGRDHGFLSSLPLYGAAAFTEIVGAMLLRGDDVNPRTLSPAEWVEAGRLGFEVTSRGPHGINEFLDALLRRNYVGKARRSPGVMYGQLNQWLLASQASPDCVPVRRLVFQHALENQPVGPGDVLYGMEFAERQWHSVHTLSQQHGIHVKTLRKLVLSHGIAARGTLDSSPDKLLVDPDQGERLALALKTCVSAEEGMAYTGMRRKAWASLCTAGYLPSAQPDLKMAGLKPIYPKRDIDAFLQRLHAAARSGNADGEFMGIAAAIKKAQCTYVQAVSSLLEGKINTSRVVAGRKPFLAVEVCWKALKTLHQPERIGLSLREVEQKLGTTTNTVKALLDCGVLAFVTVRRGEHKQRLVLPEELERFHARYISAWQLSLQSSVAMGRLVVKLRNEGVCPAFDLPRPCARFYDRGALARRLSGA